VDHEWWPQKKTKKINQAWRTTTPPNSHTDEDEFWICSEAAIDCAGMVGVKRIDGPHMRKPKSRGKKKKTAPRKRALRLVENPGWLRQVCVPKTSSVLIA
jgi:hypothetical protein